LDQPRRPEPAPVRTHPDHQLGPALQRPVGDRVHVSDDQVGPVPGRQQRVGAAVHADQHRLDIAQVRLQRRQVLLVRVPPHNDDAGPPGEPGPHRRHPAALEQQVPFGVQELHRVRRERLQLGGQPVLGTGHAGRHPVGVLAYALGDRERSDPYEVTVHCDQITVTHVLEDTVTEIVEQRDTRLDEHLGPERRVPAGHRGPCVEHRRHPGRHQRLGRHPVQVDVVDERDVARA
jgi:hypothetical protein